MATHTTTIRVTRDTRDLLARQAAERGMSLSGMLTSIAERETREAIFRAEREAIVADRENPQVAAEEQEWDATVGDGIE